MGICFAILVFWQISLTLFQVILMHFLKSFCHCIWNSELKARKMHSAMNYTGQFVAHSLLVPATANCGQNPVMACPRFSCFGQNLRHPFLIPVLKLVPGGGVPCVVQVVVFLPPQTTRSGGGEEENPNFDGGKYQMIQFDFSNYYKVFICYLLKQFCNPLMIIPERFRNCNKNCIVISSRKNSEPSTTVIKCRKYIK